MNGHLTTSATFLTKAGASLENRDNAGNTALLHAIIWGRVDSVHFLLAKGANVRARTGRGADGGEENRRNRKENVTDAAVADVAVAERNDGLDALELARRRMARLLRPNNGDLEKMTPKERTKLIDEGKELCELLCNVREKFDESYAEWARHHVKECPHVVKWMPELRTHEMKAKLLVLRELRLVRRANMLTKSAFKALKRKRVEKEREDRRADAEAERKRVLNESDAISLEDRLESAGMERGFARDLRFLGVRKFTDLSRIENADVAMLGDLDRAEKRRLWLWIKQVKEEELAALMRTISLKDTEGTGDTCGGGGGGASRGEGGSESKRRRRKSPTSADASSAIAATTKKKKKKGFAVGVAKKKKTATKKGQRKKKTTKSKAATKGGKERDDVDPALRFMDGLDLCYRESMPKGAFLNVMDFLWKDAKRKR